MKTSDPLSPKLLTSLLSTWQAAGFFFAALTCYSVPLILDNYPAIDAPSRTGLATSLWSEEGRTLSLYLMYALNWSTPTLDVFPLSLLLAIVIMTCALCRLAHRWFSSPTVMQCTLLLPLWYNPYFLPVLSWHEACIPITLSMAMAVIAITYQHRIGLFHWGFSCILVMAGMSIHVAMLNLFLGLACVDVLQHAHARPGNREARVLALHHIKVAAGAVSLYLLVGGFVAPEQVGLAWPTLDLFIARSSVVAHTLALFITPLNAVIFSSVAVVAVVGWWVVFHQAGHVFIGARAPHFLLCGLSGAGLVWATGGVTLFSRQTGLALDPLAMIGAAPLMVGLLCLAYVGLVRIRPGLTLALYAPLFCFLSFAYAYGQIVRDKHDQESFTRDLVAADLLNHSAFFHARETVILRESNDPLFSPVCLRNGQPLMDYLSNDHYMMLPEHLAKRGLNNVRLQPIHAAVPPSEPVLIRPFYRLYLENELAYVRLTPTNTRLDCSFL